MCNNQYKPAPKERANTVNLTTISTETYQYEIKCHMIQCQWTQLNISSDLSAFTARSNYGCML